MIKCEGECAAGTGAGSVVGSVMVVGGGISGMRSALDLAEAGLKVYLVEEKPAIGGILTGLDRTFPDNDCPLCIGNADLAAKPGGHTLFHHYVGRHANIDLLTGTKVKGVTGEAGNFKVQLEKKARFVDTAKCIGCGECAGVCPVELPGRSPSGSNGGLESGSEKQKAIYRLHEQAMPLAYAIEKGVCSECGQCIEVCQAGAIDLNMQDTRAEITVGAVILSPGAGIYDPTELGYLGYGKYPNVVTSIEFEGMLSASGTSVEHLVRPSDHQRPRRIAWLQCVGSRNVRLKHDYCSAVCCMYAIKEAIVAKERSEQDLETTIFLIDRRTCGKGYDRYADRARDEYGVRFVKSRIFCIKELAGQNGDLVIRYSDENGRILAEEFDLAVLSVGLEPAPSSMELARSVGVELDEFGFCKTGELARGITSRPGIFSSGTFNGPKDIAASVVEASAAASYASRILAGARGMLVKTKAYPPEKVMGKGAPRTGVFICHCGTNIGGTVNVPETVEYIRQIKNVVFACDFIFACSQESIEKIKELIKEKDLDRVVVASCTPRTHGVLFASALQESGLNPYLYEHVNIREQCSWVHRDNKLAATQKAKRLIKAAVARVALLKPVVFNYTGVNHTALVAGGGAAGMSAALSLAEQGYDVCLVEKEEELGGHARHIHYTLSGEDPQKELHRLIDELTVHPRVTIYTGAELRDSSGAPGNYKTTIKAGGKTRQLEHGVTILATGAKEITTTEYLYGEHKQVVTQAQFEQNLAAGGGRDLRDVVMIQCVGSRNQERPYCSRICCQQALKNALKLKETNPQANVFILYRDLRSYGLTEKYYTRARQEGIIFIRYHKNEKPVVTAGQNNLKVSVKDHILGRQVLIDAQLLVLSTGIEPHQGNRELSRIFKIPLDADGFFQEDDLKMRPVEFAANGMYLCGLAHAPKPAGEAILQAHAAAMQAGILLSKDRLENVSTVATVNHKRCLGCGMCVEACNYHAREIDPYFKIAKVNESLCRGCGACVAACPNAAAQQKGFEMSQVLAPLKSALR